MTLCCTSRCFPKGIRKTERFWLEHGRKSVRRYNTTRLWESTQLQWSTRILGKSKWDQKMQMMEYIIRYMIGKYRMIRDDRGCYRRCKCLSIYCRVSPIYTSDHSVHLSYPCATLRRHGGVHLRYPGISMQPPYICPVPSWFVVVVVRNGFSRHNRLLWQMKNPIETYNIDCQNQPETHCLYRDIQQQFSICLEIRWVLGPVRVMFTMWSTT
jgi:hypothetical protein